MSTHAGTSDLGASACSERPWRAADVEVVMTDMNTADTQQLIEAVHGAAGIVLLAPPDSVAPARYRSCSPRHVIGCY